MDPLSALLLIALGSILTCLAGLGLLMWLMSQALKGKG